MEMKIVRGSALLEARALNQGGEVYLPLAALADTAGTWGDLVFYRSPLAGKRIVVAFLSSSTSCHDLPRPIESFLQLCAAAGAKVMVHNGGRFPAGDLVVAIEPGGRQIYVNYLGAKWRSRPLANRVCAALKQGMHLAYLPDPVPFHKPQYNLRFGLVARWLVPAIAIQWPDDNRQLTGWLFSALMGYFGAGEPDGNLFVEARPLPQTEPPPAPPQQPEEKKPESLPLPAQDKGEDLATEPTGGPQQPAKQQRRPLPAGKSAAMSRAQYPEFFAILEQKKKRKPVRSPFG